MARSYLPASLAAVAIWADNFSTLISANPGLYGLSAGDAAAIATPTNTFDNAYAISQVPATRTPVTVAATQAARNALTSVIRTYGRIISSNAGVSDADKTALGLIIRDPVPTPIPPPATAPILGCIGATPGILTLTYRDSMSAPTVKAKPFGAVGLELHCLFGTVAPITPAATPFVGIITRTPFGLNTSGATPGQTAVMYGRWINAKGEAGPWSPLLTYVIA